MKQDKLATNSWTHDLHDWTRVSILVEWEKKGMVTIMFHAHEDGPVALLAEGLADLHVPKQQGWGPSMSVNCASGPTQLDNGNFRLKIEMQTGDIIELEAASISMPRA
ncbi:MAG: hypothetical protein ACYDDO_15055 [Acidiferrobacterales bacterium]